MKKIILLLFLSANICLSQKLSKEERQAQLDAKKTETKKTDDDYINLIIEAGKKYGLTDIFKFDRNGLSSTFVVTRVDSLNQSQLFIKSINWIKETYDTPDEVIKTKINNEKVRFKGVSSNAICHYGMGMKYCQDVRYTIELAFKDGRYKFEVMSLENYFGPSQYSSGGWNSIYLNDKASSYYKNNNKLKKMFREYPKYIMIILNELNFSLYGYLNNNQSVKDDSDW